MCKPTLQWSNNDATRFSEGKTDTLNLHKANSRFAVKNKGLSEGQQEFNTLCGSQNGLVVDLQRFTEVKTDSTMLYKYATRSAGDKTDSPNPHKATTRFAVVITDSPMPYKNATRLVRSKRTLRSSTRMLYALRKRKPTLHSSL